MIAAFAFTIYPKRFRLMKPKTRQNYKTQNSTPGLMQGGVIMTNIQQWKENRKAEAERKAAYMANLKLPFAAEYGEHKVTKGDIYAVVVHTDRYDSSSDFTVKFYTVQKRIGRCYLYPCDEHGTITEGIHGKYRREPTIKAYRKIA